MHTKDIDYRMQNWPLPFEASSDHLTKTTINLMNANNTLFNVNSNSQQDASSGKFSLCCVAHQVIIPAYTQESVLVSCQGARLMTIEIQNKVAQQKMFHICTKSNRHSTWKPSYVYNENMMTKPVNLPRFMKGPLWVTCPKMHHTSERGWAPHAGSEGPDSNAMLQT